MLKVKKHWVYEDFYILEVDNCLLTTCPWITSINLPKQKSSKKNKVYRKFYLFGI